MKSFNIVAVALCLAVLSLYPASVADSLAPQVTAIGGRPVSGGSSSAPNIISGLASMPLAFTQNQGQWPDSILFRANAGGATMWFTKNGAYYQFTRQISHSRAGGKPVTGGRQMSSSAPLSADAAHEDIRRAQDVTQPGEPVSGVEGRTGASGAPPFTVGSDRFDHQLDSLETMMIKANFVGSNPQATIRGEGMMEYKCNYFLGNDPSKWRTDVPNYSTIAYEDIYPGIDLKYYGNGKQMEYDFIISPGADPAQIQVRYEGVKSLSVNEAGELVVETGWGEVTERRREAFQLDGTQLIGAEYALLDSHSFSFKVENGYEMSLSLIIDPVLTYSTYLGGSGDERSRGIAVDLSGSAYVTGYTYSTDFPTVNPYQTDQDYGDVFVTKLSGAGNSLIYSTYLGGSNQDVSYGIAVDNSGSAYVTGWTQSSDFPTVNPYQTDQDYGDVFVTKLSGAGNSLIYSTYLGGMSEERAFGIAVDASGSAYVTGYTLSPDFPTLNPYQAQGSGDVFITKLSSPGSSLVYSTYLGGTSDEYAWGIAVDTSGSAYVTGYTWSTDFPTVNPYQTDQDNLDVFVTKLSSTGSSLIYSTYLGGSNEENGSGIAVDDSGFAYIIGRTYSTNFPTVNQYQTDQGGNDAFVTKLSSAGNSLIYSTYLGGSDDEWVGQITVDNSGCAYVTGATLSSDFPTVNPYQTHQGDWDVFVTKLSSTGNSLIYSTYLGGNSLDEGYDVAVDVAGAAYVTGSTWSSDFPTLNPYQTDQDTTDVFVTKLTVSCCNGDGLRGDVDMSGTINVADVTYLVYYLFRGGPLPPCFEEGDVDGSGAINVADVTYLVYFLFRSGPPPPLCP